MAILLCRRTSRRSASRTHIYSDKLVRVRSQSMPKGDLKLTSAKVLSTVHLHFSGEVGSQTYSAPVEFKPTAENNELVLTLDKTPTEFLQLYHQQSVSFPSLH